MFQIIFSLVLFIPISYKNFFALLCLDSCTVLLCFFVEGLVLINIIALRDLGFGYYQTVHPAPPSSTQLHSDPSTSTLLISTSTQLISISTQLHLLLPSSFQPPTSSLQHPQQYLNQNIAHNWTISPNFGQRI